VVYKDLLETEKAGGEYWVGIDVGLNNLLAVVSENPSLKSFIVSGKELKAFNQWFNKEKARLQSQIEALRKENRVRGTSRDELDNLYERLGHLSALRKRFFDNELHKLSRKLVEILSQTSHCKIYIGTGGTESKQNINMGKRNNQHFVSIPFRRLIDLITYKAAQMGMEIIETSEEYTSKSSSVSDDIVEIQKLVKKGKRDIVSFSGKRIHRGLYRDSKLGKVLNADTNGALNILKAGAQLHKVRMPRKILLIKLANPVRARLMTFYYQVSGKSLLIAGSIT